MNNKIEIHQTTLDAIAQALCGGDQGINITPLVEALAVGRNKSLVAVQAALLLKGIPQNVDTVSRYRVVRYSDNNSRPNFVAYRYDYKATGIFDEQVSVTQTIIASDTSNMKYRAAEYKVGLTEEKVIDYDTWYELKTGSELSEEEVKLIEHKTC